MAAEQKKEQPLGPDPHSYANINEIRVTHLKLNLKVNFPEKRFQGFVDIDAEVVGPSASVLKLDVKNLAIESVQDASGELLQWTLPQHHSALGQCLVIPFPTKTTGQTVSFRVHYLTTERSGGIQFLDAEQTAEKKHPLVYTQGEAILSRTLVPCQDTPAVKAPYDISVTCPAPLVAVCAGVQVGDVVESNGWRTYVYKQTNPIPAYLIAIVCGDLVRRDLSARCAVWSERPLADASEHEFKQHTEQYLQAGEKVTGVKYDWGRYDMVVLPAAFPYGGMENPNLTFLSRSLLAGDRSLTNVVAHEITHSWAGNYVTNSSWSDFWLNEGFTVYIERMILGEVFGSKAYRDFECLNGYNDLVKTVRDTDYKEWTKLCPDLTGVDPDDAFSKVPYEKGSLFLLYLESLVGGEMAMRGWLKTYFETFRNKSLSTADMKKHFLGYFHSRAPADKLAQINWEEWLHAPGMPAFDPNKVLDRSLVVACDALAAKWAKGQDGKTATADDLKALQSKQIMFFLDILITSQMPMEHAVLQHMDALYHLSASPNVEVNYRFLSMCLKSGYKPAMDSAGQFLGKHGRGLYVKPLYKLLKQLDHDRAKTIYQTNRSFYHTVIRDFCQSLGL